MKPVGLAAAHGSAIERVAGIVWLSMQIGSGNPPSDEAIKKALAERDAEPSGENVAKVRELIAHKGKR